MRTKRKLCKIGCDLIRTDISNYYAATETAIVATNNSIDDN